jgi:hypothetical protein
MSADFEAVTLGVSKIAEPTNRLRWLGSKETTTEPRRLQQWVKITVENEFTGSGNVSFEWQDIPLELE